MTLSRSELSRSLSNGRVPAFDGMRVKLRKTTSGRYALGFDIELAADGEKAESPRAESSKRERASARALEDLEDVESIGDDEEEENEEAFAASDRDDGDDGGEVALDADDDGDDGEAALASGEDGDPDDDGDDLALASDADVDDDEGERAFASDADDDEDEPEQAIRARWPNRRPVVKGVLEVSQAPALFDDDDDDDDDDEALAEGRTDEHGDSSRETPPQARSRAFDERPEPTSPRPASSAAASPEPAPSKPTPPKPAPSKPAPSKGNARARAVKALLDQARKSIGLGEKPPGSNHNKITVWYNKNIARIGNGPWCNMAVTYWAGLSSNLAAIFAGKGVGYAYTVAHAQKFAKKKRWHKGVAGIRAGDVVFFDWGGSRSISKVDHVGVVEQVKGKRIVTIEGNTTGDRCRRMVRDAKFIVGYGRPAYGA